MALYKLKSNLVADSKFFNILDDFTTHELPNMEGGIILLSNNKGDKVSIDLADIFVFNSLMLKFISPNSPDIVEQYSYSAKSAYQLHSLVIYLSNRFPNLVLNEHDAIAKSIIQLVKTIRNRRKDRAENFFFVEESADSQYVNITCNADCFLKVDLIDQRFFMMNGGKIGMGSMNFLHEKYRKAIISEINSLFTCLNIEKVITGEELVHHDSTQTCG